MRKLHCDAKSFILALLLYYCIMILSYVNMVNYSLACF